MNSAAFKWSITAFVFLITLPAFAQDTRAFNQNSSRSNHTRAFNQNASRSNHTRLGFSMSPVFSTPVDLENDSLQFRGTGGGFTLGADYYIGHAAIGVTAGFISSKADASAINNFISKRGIAIDHEITTSRQQTMYLLIGPSVQFGNTMSVEGHIKGGMFFNSGGLVSIQQRGAQRAAYRTEPTDKGITPGYAAGLKGKYTSPSHTWSFSVGADLIRSKTNVVNYDARRGGGMEGLRVSQPLQDVVVGLTFTYNITQPRNRNADVATGKKHIGNVKYESARATSATATGEPACGPVTEVRTYPDGTKEEMTFSCPADAAAYKAATGTVPRQTQGATFGEKVNAGLNNAASGVRQTQGASFGEKVKAGINSAAGVARSISADADMDGDGIYEKDVTAIVVDEVEFGGKDDTPQQRAGISTSRSNIRTRSSLQPVTDDLYVSYGTAMIDGKEVMVKTVLKTKHDTVKNSVNNIR